MKNIIFSFVFASVFVSLTSFAEFLPVKVAVPLTKAYIPQGFDSNDISQIVVEGTLTNTCDKVGTTKVAINTESKFIYIEQSIYKYNRSGTETCIDVKVSFKSVLDLGILPEGNYTVKNVIINGSVVGFEKELGQLPIKAAKTGPDDHVYAIIDSASLNVIGGDRAITLRGQLPGPCWVLKGIKVLPESDDVITLLPLIEYDSTYASVCDTGKTTQFINSVKLPTKYTGRVLVHVRSLNGLSVNEIVDL